MQKLSDPNKIYSWEIIGDNVASKHMDLSCFMHSGSTIPREIYNFFDAEEMKMGERKNIVLSYEDYEYPAHLIRDSGNTGRIRIFWNSQLAHTINGLYDYDEIENTRDFPYMTFIKHTSTSFDLRFSRIPEHATIIQDASSLDEVYEDELILEQSVEGNKKERYSVFYERNAKNRENAIKIHGLKCMVCGFDFEEFYGNRGKGYIEVHHNKPLHELSEPMIVDPEKDLDCVCANCHRMIHRIRSNVISIDELRKIVLSKSLIIQDKD